MRLLFIRHGATAGNREKRYIGRTDEPLCNEGIIQLKALSLPKVAMLFCSPMKRCIQTAEIIFPETEMIIENGFRECDFGVFEGKNYIELTHDPLYQKWINSNGKLPFPNGESPEGFRSRCVKAFEKAVSEYSGIKNAAFVVHGGTIMSIFEKYTVPHRDYYDWHCENGHGYICEWNGKELKIMEKI